MHPFVITVEVTRTETYVVQAEDSQEARELWYGDRPVDMQTTSLIVKGAEPMDDLDVMRDEDGSIVAIFCPGCGDEVYEDDVFVVATPEHDGDDEWVVTGCCGLLIEDPNPLFNEYNEQD